ncbi:MAG TPA: 1,4-dihydroxy-2-naphthoate polyprenyltransferase [Candidatus Omnitrophota bacterium]|nr:1,4-dihydroxy-2-naphthoate polyprenyltransferase [Candidatus Omnitrophota bacterium]
MDLPRKSPASFKTWISALRLYSLPASIGPVVIGIAMAFGDGVHHFPTAILCLLGAAAIQIGTNLANDYYDYKRGADTADPNKPLREIPAGLLAPEAVKTGFIIAFVFAAVISGLLIQRGGRPIAVIAVVSIVSGLLYTAGPRPLGYLGLGDLFVLVFFGPVSVAGTYYVQSFEMNLAVLLAGISPGMISVGILTANNLRDIDSDRAVGKLTLAVRFGRFFAMTEYLLVITIAALMPVLIFSLIQDHSAILASVIILFISIPAILTVTTKSDGHELTRAIEHTGKILVIFSILFSIGWIL